VGEVTDRAHRRAILDSLDFDFFELLRQRHHRTLAHIQTFYDTKDIGQFPERRKPLSFHSPLTQRTDVMSFNEIFEQLSLLSSLYMHRSATSAKPTKKYEEMYDTQVAGGKASSNKLIAREVCRH
jgi:hypothetical protein